MKKITLEQRLLASHPRQAKNRAFIDRTMEAMRTAHGRETFTRVLRITNITKQESWIVKLKHSPKWAVIGLAAGGAILASGSAYAAYREWWQDPANYPTSCHGNPQDVCTSITTVTDGTHTLTNPHPTGTIPIYPSGGMSAGLGSGKVEIQGKLLSHEGKTFTLRASSEDIFTVTGSEDFIAEYNTAHAHDWEKYNYSNPGTDLSIAIGDTLVVDYSPAAGSDVHHITATEFKTVSLVVVGDAKAGTLQKY